MDHQLKSEQLTVTISFLGAEVTSVCNSDGLEFMWQAGELWPRHAPVLFPIVGRLKGDRYLAGDKNYQLSQHGFARDQGFELVQGKQNVCTLELRAGEKSRILYPGEFIFRITYILEKNTLECKYEVQNAGGDKMYFSVGAHPAFRCPLQEGEAFTDYFIEFEQRSFMVTGLDGGLRSNETRLLPLEGKKLRLSRSLFDRDALVFENGQVNRVRLASEHNAHSVTMRCEGWPYFGIWSKKGGDQFLCLEPWYGIADHLESTGKLEEKTGIISLKPGATFTCGYTTTFV